MKKDIKADKKFDKPLDKLVFSDDGGKFELSLIFVNSDEKNRLERIINAFMGATSGLLNFDTDDSSDIAINVIGNIPEALKFLNQEKMISNELYSRIEAESELSDFLTQSGSYVMYKVDKNDLSFLLDSDDEDKKPTDTTSNKKTTTQTSQGGIFGESGKNPPADSASSAPSFTQSVSPSTPTKVK